MRSSSTPASVLCMRSSSSAVSARKVGKGRSLAVSHQAKVQTRYCIFCGALDLRTVLRN